MASDRTAHYTKMYSDALALNAQQMKSRFERGAVSQQCSGEHASILEFVGKSTVLERTTRGEQKVIADKDHTRRWVEPTPYFTESDIVDGLDDLRAKTDPTGMYVKSQLAAINRKKDDDFIAAIHGNAKTGKSGTDTTAWDTSNNIAAAAFSITTVKAAIQKLQENEVILEDDSEELFMALTPDQFNVFTGFNEVSNADYGNTVYDKSRYMIDSWLGINIIVTNRLIDGSGVRADVNPGLATTREIPLWAKSGMSQGIWKDVHGSITQSTDRAGEPMLITTYADYGFARNEENKVIKIIVDETA